MHAVVDPQFAEFSDFCNTYHRPEFFIVVYWLPHIRLCKFYCDDIIIGCIWYFSEIGML